MFKQYFYRPCCHCHSATVAITVIVGVANILIVVNVFATPVGFVSIST